MRLRFLRSWNLVSIAVVFFIWIGQAAAEPLTLARAIQLALSHSSSIAATHADVQHAIAAYREMKDAYIPQLFLGSGLGWTYGFPLTIEGAAPSIVTVASQSTVFNFAQNQYLGAAKAEIQSAQIQNKDQRIAVIQDVALSFTELVKWETRLTRLNEDDAQVQQMVEAIAKRVQEGIDSNIDLNKAKLVAARLRLHRAEARGSADVLRRHLSDLTGVPIADLALDSASVPSLPPVQSDETSQQKAVSSNPTVKIAEEHSLAEAMKAVAEHRMKYPSLDFSAQYARLSTFNNYDEYYRKFQPDNATVGVAIRIPLFNASQRARASAADSEALKAKKQLETTRNNVSEETLKLERAAEQLEAARDVAQLEYELAQSTLEAVRTRIEEKTATLHEFADAQVQANERYLLFQDADFEYQRARVNLLRATGELERWALPTSTP